MSTPITDAAANDSIVKVYETSKRLETDRAALMEVLERMANTSANGFTFCRCCDYVVKAGHAPACTLNNALSAARANFPQP